MKKFLTALLIAGCFSFSAYAVSVKLGDVPTSIFAKSFEGKNINSECVEGDENCRSVESCGTDADCAHDEYCSSLKICKYLCENGKTQKGVKCATLKNTPVCAIETSGHKSYCACTQASDEEGDSCEPAYECRLSGTQIQCVACAAGQKCRCPDGKMSNGSGDCVVCNGNYDCSGDEVCTNAGTTSSYCETLNCPEGTYVGNHECNSCGGITPHCAECDDGTCTGCDAGYDLIDGVCVKKDCGDGYYLDESDGTCKPCGTGCKSCSNPNTCDDCLPGYELKDGVCVAKDCPEGYTLNKETGECESCPTPCLTCAESVENSSETAACTSCPADYHLVNGECVLNGCADIGKAASCESGKTKTADGTAPNGEECYTCSSPDGPAPNPNPSPDPDPTPSGSCPSGYSTSVMSCDSGYDFKTDGSVNGKKCGKCEPKACPSGYSTSVSSCGAKQALETKGMSGEKDCGKCVDVSCPSDKPAWNGSKCVECTGNIHCPSHKYCKNNVCVLSAGRCDTGSDCKSSGDGCTDHSCVPLCREDTCSGQTPKCVVNNHTFVGCECTNTSCNSGYECRTHVPLNKCESRACKKDSDCTSGQKCSSKKCIDACTGVTCSGKTPKTYATKHKCYCECTGDSCGAGYECRFGTPTNTCVTLGCKKDSDCEGSKKCTNNKCVSLCDPNPCSGNTPKCYASKHSYVCECQIGSEAGCPSGQVCAFDSPKNKCKPKSQNGNVETTEKCETDTDCVAAKRCSKGYCVYRE